MQKYQSHGQWSYKDVIGSFFWDPKKSKFQLCSISIKIDMNVPILKGRFEFYAKIQNTRTLIKQNDE